MAKTKVKDKKKSKAKAEAFKLERTTERVKHNFLDDELIGFGFSLGQKYRSIRAIQSEKKAVVADYTAREKSIEADIDEISGKINAGFEMRAKPCFRFYDYKGGRVYWFLCDDIKKSGLDLLTFPDLDEILKYLLKDEAFDAIKDREITDQERQAKLFDDEKAQGDEGKQPEVITD